jgi:hypothetical protein
MMSSGQIELLKRSGAWNGINPFGQAYKLYLYLYLDRQKAFYLRWQDLER